MLSEGLKDISRPSQGTKAMRERQEMMGGIWFSFEEHWESESARNSDLVNLGRRWPVKLTLGGAMAL